MGVGGQSKAQATLPPGKKLRTHCVGGWAPGSIWIGAENLARIGIRSPDLPGRSESLYRLHYPGPSTHRLATKFIFTLSPEMSQTGPDS
jgi:hypothetical protein